VARELRFRFPLAAGLHARPAARLREVVEGCVSEVTFANARNRRTANARSTLALVATLTREGDECTITVGGEDEVRAAERIEHFLADEFPHCDDALLAAPPAAQHERHLPRVLRRAGARVFPGVVACPGIARAPALLLVPWRRPENLAAHREASPEGELAALARALSETSERLRERIAASTSDVERAIAAVQLDVLEDVELRKGTEEEITSRGASAGQAVLTTIDRFAGVLRESGSAYLGERVLDLRDVARLLVDALVGELPADGGAILEHDAVCVAESLGPALLLALDKRRLKGLVLAHGGTTSHALILARALGIPCLTGMSGVERALHDGQEVVVDAVRGFLVVDPPPPVVRFYEREAANLQSERERLANLARAPGVTADGRPLPVAANVGSLDEARLALANGADGIGLFRTELLFAGRPSPPSEEEQARIYTEVARAAAGRPVVIRTLDVGGDKPLPYLDLPAERNPFLGFRGIRLYDRHAELVGAQLRAILRAAAHGNVSVMFPMVASLEETRALRGVLEREIAALTAAGVACGRNAGVGIMVEVPSIALVLDQLAGVVDFFSIGSNDLLQYFVAVDRDNERVAHLYDPFQPAFVRLLAGIGRQAGASGVRLALCGELGADPLAVPLLVGCGVQEISAGPADVPAVKAAVARCDTAACRRLAEEVAALATAAEVRAHLAAAARAGVDRSLTRSGLVRLHSASRTREEAIRELVDLVHLAGRTADPDALEDAVWRREETVSTAVGAGVAIPHCRSDAVEVSSVALATYDHAIPWPPGEDGPVKIAILIAVAADDPGEAGLRMIANLSRRLLDEDFREGVLGAANAAEVTALLSAALTAE
jgi:multiphosphoryl transfer protein